MREIHTEIKINADSKRVWAVLTNYEGHQRWNPFIKSWSGDKEKGGKLEVLIEPPGGNAMTFKPTILKFDEERELRWLGRLGIPGIFDGEHYFQIEQISDNQVRFIQGEKFKGILIPFLGSIFPKTIEGFNAMNEALKSECENSQL